MEVNLKGGGSGRSTYRVPKDTERLERGGTDVVQKGCRGTEGVEMLQWGTFGTERIIQSVMKGCTDEVHNGYI